MVRNFDLLMIVEHVDNNSPSLRVYLQKIGLKEKVEQVEEQTLGSKVNLQKVKIKHVKEGSTWDIQVQIVDQIYNQRFQKYLNYYWIQNP